MDLTSLLPGTEGSKNVISRTILIQGAPLSNEIKISQIIVSKVFNKIASAKVVLLDGSVPKRDFPLSNGDRFKPGNEITVQLGYRGKVDTVFVGVIVKHGIKARKKGASVLVVEAKDRAIKLIGERKSAYHINKTDKDVIDEIAKALKPDVDKTTVTHEQLIQFESTDWDFICMRAEANGMLVLTDDGTLVVKKPGAAGSAALKATYGDNIFEFEAEMDARRQAAEVKSTSWDYTKQALEQSDVGTASFSEPGNLKSEDLATVLGANMSLTHPGHLTTTQLQAWSDAYELRKQVSKAVGRVRVAGNAAVKPGSKITLAGVGDRFNGDVVVTGVLHTYDGTWYTDIQFGWSEDWFYRKEDVMERPASGLLPGVNGLQIGLVVDTNDSEGGQFRVKVRLPTITSGNEGLWARVATLDAGKNRGVFFRPQRDDEVVLGFLGDDPREPIILGYVHSKSEHPSLLPEEKDKQQYGFVTKEGLKLVFDDSNKRLTVTVPGGAATKTNTVTIDGSSGAMELKDQNQNTIKMDSGGITIQSAKVVTIKGSQVKIN